MVFYCALLWFFVSRPVWFLLAVFFWGLVVCVVVVAGWGVLGVGGFFGWGGVGFVCVFFGLHVFGFPRTARRFWRKPAPPTG